VDVSNRFTDIRLKPDSTWAKCVIAAALMMALAGTLTLHAQSGAAAGAKPAPRIDGHPDLNGTWDTGYNEIVIGFVRPQQLEGGSVCVSGCAPAGGAPRGGGAGRAGGAPPARDFPKYKADFQAKVKDLEARQVKEDSILRCEPPGVPRIGPPAKIVQTRREVIFFYDDVNGGFFRVVPIDRPHRKDVPRSYLGDSIGKWEGDALVVETVNFNEDTWLTDDGAFHTRDLKVIERLRRVGDTIEYQATVHDPAVLAEPWSPNPRTLKLTDRELEESPRCEDRSLAHMQDLSNHDNPR
jgi:hypothetical protein